MFSIGSTGDVRPYVLMGQELKRRGHQITIITFASFEGLVREAGLGFRGISGSASEMMNALLKPSVKGIAYLRAAENVLGKHAAELIDEFVEGARGADAMMCTFLSSVFYSIAELFGIPCIQTHYYPMDQRNDMPISSAPGQTWGKEWNQLSYKLAYLLLGMVERKYLTDWRDEMGVRQRPVKSSPDYTVSGRRIPVIYAVSPEILPRPAEWPSNIYLSGFWQDTQPISWTPPQALADFLAAGEPPIYIGFGSMVSGNMDRLFRMIAQAVTAAGKRAILVTGWSGAAAISDSKNTFVTQFVPHDWLFPKVSAVVHHGGAGTFSSGLRWGCPTLVLPFGGDQPFWGQRIYDLGCGPKPIARNKITLYKLTKAFLDLTENPDYRAHAAAIGKRLQAENGVSLGADIIEKELFAWKESLSQ